MIAAEERETIPVPSEPSIPEHAPESAKAIALGFDRATGGDGRWVRRTIAELGLVLGGES